MQELLGLSQRQYDLITTAAIGDKSHWGFDATGDLTQLRKVSEVMLRARLSFAELQDLLESSVVNPGHTIAVDMKNCCDPALMVFTGSDSNLYIFLDRLHRYVRLWRALGWDTKVLDCALNPTLSASPVLNESSVIMLAHFIATFAKLTKEQTSPLEFVDANWPVNTNGVVFANLGRVDSDVADVIVLLSIGK